MCVYGGQWAVQRGESVMWATESPLPAWQEGCDPIYQSVGFRPAPLARHRSRTWPGKQGQSSHESQCTLSNK